ncbi:Flp family type IVb pilin [Vibrio cincinnatiensis]|uniref:Flp family type IVb pilin n=1 Tax=Vibrio cincinnatiensis TaxID=675 RepID=UPI001EDFFF97|nr:Flp family type IVb pilin [Vibrio cincinnatiensis]MCG3765509.1 Flp family type IVb pilin [Vibrio cincinnatiensis]
MLTKLYVKSRLLLDSFAKDQRGVTAIEYAIIGVAISAIVLAVFSGDNGLKEALTDAVEEISNNIDAVKTQTPTPTP